MARLQAAQIAIWACVGPAATIWPADLLTFTAASSVATGGNPKHLTIGDFNQDGRTDIAVADAVSSTVTVLIGDGAGGLLRVGSYAARGPVATGDLDGDGWIDLAGPSGDGDVTLLFGDGTGAFPRTAEISLAFGVGCVGAADFNGDGKTDLLAAGDGQAAILVRDKGGALHAGSAYNLYNSPLTIAIGDIDGDGKPDAALGDPTDAYGTITILIGNGSGGFRHAFPILMASYPSAIVIRDLNGDGRADLAVSGWVLSLALGDGTGGFGPPSHKLGLGQLGLAVSDVDGDGHVDLVCGRHPLEILVLPGDGAGQFGAPRVYGSGQTPRALPPRTSTATAAPTSQSRTPTATALSSFSETREETCARRASCRRGRSPVRSKWSTSTATANATSWSPGRASCRASGATAPDSSNRSPRLGWA